jgi:pyruvate/2-oxoglutarate dehydrogenase complex dihydrolipoamide dehydrogenase (E3) component
VRGHSGEEVGVSVRLGSDERTIEGSDLLVAAGRVLNIDGIGLEQAGVERTERGYVRVNERLETSAPSVWALGECAGSPQFTHASVDDFRIIRDNLSGGNRSTRDRLVPFGSSPIACLPTRGWRTSGFVKARRGPERCPCASRGCR